MTPDQIFAGVALTVGLAVGSQILAARLRIPGIVVLLPVGFAAGALTDVVNPHRLLGPSFPHLVALAVAVILFESGLGLNLAMLKGATRRVVVRLIFLGVPITWAIASTCAALFLGMSRPVAIMLGAILVVSGPTVVLPLLDFIRPTKRLRQILAWEGTLIDPVGGILGALVFHALTAVDPQPFDYEFLQFLLSLGFGLAGGLAGAALLWLILRQVPLSEALGGSATIAVVIAVAAACEIGRDDTGLISAIIMGLAVANLPGIDVPARRPFFETLVHLILGVLFISISATVTLDSLRSVWLPALLLVAVLVMVARPLVAAFSTLRTGLSVGERGFLAWLAPRGVVAAATASAFSTALVSEGMSDARAILPATFVVIVATVTLYGLTAAPVARLLGVLRPARTRPFLVGGRSWVIDIGRALQASGLRVLMWAGLETERTAITDAGLDLAPGELLADASGRGAEMEGVTAVLLLTEEDDFNALAGVTLVGTVDGPVYRAAPPRRSQGVIAPYTGCEILFGYSLDGRTIDDRHHRGARIVTRPAGAAVPDGGDLLFVVRADGRLEPVTEDQRPAPRAGDTLVLLTPALGRGVSEQAGRVLTSG